MLLCLTFSSLFCPALITVQFHLRNPADFRSHISNVFSGVMGIIYLVQWVWIWWCHGLPLFSHHMLLKFITPSSSWSDVLINLEAPITYQLWLHIISSWICAWHGCTYTLCLKHKLSYIRLNKSQDPPPILNPWLVELPRACPNPTIKWSTKKTVFKILYLHGWTWKKGVWKL